MDRTDGGRDVLGLGDVRIEQRIERLNDLGFDVDELDIITDFDGDSIRIQPRVVELGHHRRELQGLTGLAVEDNQARRLLNDIASFAASHDLGREDRMLVAARWMNNVYEPIMAMVPADYRGKLEQAEIYHEILVHRWYLSERANFEISIFDAARDFIDTHLSRRRDEALASIAEELEAHSMTESMTDSTANSTENSMTNGLAVPATDADPS